MVDRLDDDPEIDFVYCNYQLIDLANKIKEMVSTGNPEDLYFHNCIGPCFLYRRKIYEAVGNYDRNCTLVEDYDYWLRIAKRFKMEKIDKYLYFFRLHTSSLTGKYGGTDFLARQLEIVKNKNLSKTMYLLSISRECFINDKNVKSIYYAFLSICFNLMNKDSWYYFLRNIKRIASNFFFL